MTTAEIAALAGALRLPGVTLLLAALATVATFVAPLPDLLEFSRAAVADGQHWRWWTGHLVHDSLDHLAWDVGAFLLLGWLCEREHRGRLLACLGLAGFLIPLGVWVAHPEIASYRGLSGIDSALFLMVVVAVLRRGLRERAPWRAATAAVLGLAFVGKVAFEIATGATLFVDSAATSAVPLPLAHAVGGAVGIAVVLAPGNTRSFFRTARRWAGAAR